ncbi:MAG: methionine gamma-lyase family protein [Hornefia sp.]|nr:methionine gamma-lyase family protein [Hornefia sp.]
MIKEILAKQYDIEDKLIDFVYECESKLNLKFQELEKIKEYNQYKVLSALQKNRISDMHFGWRTGYGYDDPGRDAAEKVYSDIFNTESALVRPTIVNGTHALGITLMGILRPGDEVVYCSNGPYDTLEEVIGLRNTGKGSLIDYGISYKEVRLKSDGSIDLNEIRKVLTYKTKMVCVQRSTGYSWRKALTVEQIRKWADFIHENRPDIICMVDNCYGEFTDILEPTDVGADIMAGSLIKNPGGGLALSGGYVCGKKELIDLVSYRMTCPGIGAECGLTFGQTRATLQGIFLAPSVVNGALKSAVLCGKVFGELGYAVCQKSDDRRSDIIQAIELGNEDSVIAFCQGIQAAAPVDSFVSPEPWDMPGYDDKVVMAAGSFIQGSSIELSADAPMRKPFIVYFQGGLTYEHGKLGILLALSKLAKKGLLKGEI